MGLVFNFFRIQKRSKKIWALDSLGIFLQTVLVPVLQTWVLAELVSLLFPSFRGSLKLSPLPCFLLSFVFVDYLYYWNHRLLHSRSLWVLHKVHHSITRLDALATSRNSAWTIFFLVYLWVQPVCVFVLDSPGWFLAGMVAGNILDAWRHSGWMWDRQNLWVQYLRSFLIDPQDHEWHHSEDRFKINYGANLNLWDRLHGTFYRNAERPLRVGIPRDESFANQFFTPWKLK